MTFHPPFLATLHFKFSLHSIYYRSHYVISKILFTTQLSSSKMSLHYVSRRLNFDARVGREGNGLCGKYHGIFEHRWSSVLVSVIVKLSVAS